jgi:flagellar capping protein FliD
MFKVTIIILSLCFGMYLLYSENKLLYSENKALKEYKSKVESLLSSMNTELNDDIKNNTIGFDTNELLEKYPEAFTEMEENTEDSLNTESVKPPFDEYSKYKI